MIKQNSIDEVRFRSDLEEIVNKYTPVKKHFASCPFHKENSSSFHIWPSKQIYKCFGCGASGDVFAFIMKQERKTFTEAVEWLADYYKIQLEYDQVSAQETQQLKDDKAEMYSLVRWANEKYIETISGLPGDSACLTYLAQRGYTAEKIKAWGLGFAPDDWKFLTTPIINMGRYNIGYKAGLVRTTNASSYDSLRLRVTVPLFDHNGLLTGIAGRMIPGGKDDKKIPKYINPDDSIIYQKKNLWYGLWQAQHAIKEANSAYIVEGYFDVHSMHDADLLNTISPCGTEADALQLKFLKRYTDELVFCYDGDKTGVEKMMKQIDIALQLDFKVKAVELPDKMDPDEFIRKHSQSQQQIISAA